MCIIQKGVCLSTPTFYLKVENVIIMIRKGVVVFFVMLLVMSIAKVTYSQGIVFKTTAIKSEIVAARAAGQPVLVYFRVDGMESCVKVETEIFADKRAGDCFNEKFVCCSIDVKENQELAMEYGIRVAPSVLMLDGKGKLAYRMEGNIVPAYLIYLGESLSGVHLALGDLYKMHVKNKKNLVITQDLLHEAFYVLNYLPMEERALWERKLMKVYEGYVKMKPLEEMVNARDFDLLTFYSRPSKGNREFEFLVADADRFRGIVNDQKMISYLVNTNNGLIRSLACNGDIGYKECLERIKGDMADMYKYLQGPGDTYTLLKMDADALYVLYGEKDQNAYVVKRNEYFTTLGEHLQVNDLLQSVQELYTMAKGKIKREAAEGCLAWLDVIEATGVQPEMRINLLLVRADCCLGCEDVVKTRGYLNEAYLLSMQTGDVRTQQYIKQKIDSIRE